jgi:hypothetical protein
LSSGNELKNPVLRFWIIMAGVLALILGRTISGALIYPPVVIWVIGVGALGTGALAVVVMVRKGNELLPSAGLAAASGGLAFAVIFGLTWLLS